MKNHSNTHSASLLVVSLTLCLTLGGEKPTHAQSALPPGTTTGIAVPSLSVGSPPFGGILLQELTSPLFGTNILNTISGTVVSAVFRNPSGFLDFAYQFHFLNTTNIVIDTISLSSFKSVDGVTIAQTSNDIDGAGGLFAQVGAVLQNNFEPAVTTGAFSSANRPNVNGDGINVILLTGVTGNEASYTFLLRTQVTAYTLAGSASVQGGGISAFTSSQGAFIPLAASAPEPTSLALIVLESLTVGMVRRRQKALREA